MAHNRLAEETSPYLLQHADNPVDWYPWGPEALELAVATDRPILLSIGYSACHWCHVMEQESFRNPAIAELMNRHFVCVKVDREERPDLDDLYMAATVALTGRGGWPMTVFLTPEQTPFFAGTYFPPHDGEHGFGFSSLLGRVADLWEKDRDGLFRQAAELTEQISEQSRAAPPRNLVPDLLDRAVAQLSRLFDEKFGGFGAAPKFPPCAALQLLMRHAYRHPDDTRTREMVVRTLDAMSRGGFFDQLEGGFCRYSTDEQWLIPHFEKMLYDNALLVRVYLEGYQLLQEPRYREVAERTLHYVSREMQGAHGGFFSSCDADCEGVEGGYFLFGAQEVRGALSPEEARAVEVHFGITEPGNWGGSNVLCMAVSREELPRQLGWEPATTYARLDAGLARLRELRAKRQKPAVDAKVLVSWNGLMISAMAEGYRVTRDVRWLQSAQRSAEFLRRNCVRDDGGLFHVFCAGVAKVPGFLDDYGFLADALIDMFEVTGDSSHLCWAQQLLDHVIANFADPAGGGFFQHADGQQDLIVRIRDGQDGALPSANSASARALLRLYHHVSDDRYLVAARDTLRAYGQRMERLPRAFAASLCAAELLMNPPVEVVLNGPPSGPVLEELGRRFLPNRVIRHRSVDDAQPFALQLCHLGVCQRPVKDPGEVAQALEEAARRARETPSSSIGHPRLPGRATAEGTRGFFETRRLRGAAHHLGRTGLSVSRLGFGGYRTGEHEPEHHRAVALAIAEGCNVFDTAPSYGTGASERLLGAAIADQVGHGAVTREQLVLVTKLGIINTSASKVEDPDWVPLGENLGYSLHPDLLEQELGGCLSRLGVESVDVVLIHNPEMLLQTLTASEVERRIERAFVWLEQQVTAGRIGHFGVSSNELPTGGLAFSLLERAAEAAQCTHFSVLEFPVNALELEALDAPPGAESLVALAERLDFGVLTNRPLNAMREGELLRLADAQRTPGAPDFESALSEVAKLEHEFRAQLGSVLLAVPGIDLPVAEFFTWAERIGEYELSSRALWDDFEQTILGPQLTSLLAAMTQAFAGKQLNEVWKRWRGRYISRFEDLVLAARDQSATRTNARNQAFAEEVRRMTPGAERTVSLSRLVLWHTSSLEGVSSVLVGMRSTSHVQDALATLRWPEVSDPVMALRNAAQIGFGPPKTRP